MIFDTTFFRINCIIIFEMELELKDDINKLKAEFEKFKIISKIELDALKRKRTKAEELLLLLSIERFTDIGRISDLLTAEIGREISAKGGTTISISENITRLVENLTETFSGEELEQLGLSLISEGDRKKRSEVLALAKKKKKQANRPAMRDGSTKGKIDGFRLFEDEVN